MPAPRSVSAAAIVLPRSYSSITRGSTYEARATAGVLPRYSATSRTTRATGGMAGALIRSSVAHGLAVQAEIAEAASATTPDDPRFVLVTGLQLRHPARLPGALGGKRKGQVCPMTDNTDWEESSDKKGHAMVPATPRDVVHVRVGSFILVFLFALGVLGIIARAPVMTGIAVVAAVVTVVDMVMAVRRQKNRNVGEAG